MSRQVLGSGPARASWGSDVRIAIFTDSFTPYRSGVTTVVENHARELARRGHRILIVRPAAWTGGDPERAEDIEIKGLPLSIPVLKAPDLYAAPPLVPAARRHLRRFKPDVAHVHTEFGCGWAGLMAARSLAIPTVGTLHTFFAEQGYQRALGLPDVRLSRSLTWRYSIAFYRRCDAVTCPSSALRDALLERGLRPEPIIVSNGIEPAPAPDAAVRAATRSRFGIPDDGAPLFVHVGRLSAEKSLDVLCDAFALVASSVPDARLIIVGDGPERAGIERRIATSGLTERILTTGQIPRDDLMASQLLGLADAFVTASTTENQPLSVMEAMIAGLPIVGPRARGIPELVADGVTGRLVEPDRAEALAGAMIELARDPERSRAMGAAAVEAMRPHALPAAIDRLLDVYASVVESGRNRERTSLRSRLRVPRRLRRDYGRPLKRVMTRTTTNAESSGTIQPALDGVSDAAATIGAPRDGTAVGIGAEDAREATAIPRPSSRQPRKP